MVAHSLCVSAAHVVDVVHTLFRCLSSFLLNTNTQLLMLAPLNQCGLPVNTHLSAAI